MIKDKLESCAAHGNTEDLDVGWEVEVGKWQTYLSSTGNAWVYAVARKQRRTKSRCVEVKTAHEGSSRNMASLINCTARIG